MTEPQAPNGEAREIIRSAEQLRVSTTRVPVRRARLERFVVTEMQTITVPVTREDVRIVYADIDPAEHLPEQPGPQRPLVLYRERIVVSTERVPVELVGLVVETVTDRQEVTGEVRSEQITLESLPTDPAMQHR